ncbi:TPA: restriction endonuclease subunit S [Streptococcus suis]|nr:restriction endonuclease subunit S [Streptococcus suis]HEM3686243.1 restriction endonuclease subunit S [Streptococcus suis]HEM3693866.1 restriction endonuclease subunit S [Streptococcus suis]
MTRMKDSGIEWIGEVPEEWGIVRLKDCLEINNGKDYKDIETDETGYPVIGSGGQFAYARKYLHDGAAILLGRKGTIDKPLYIEGKFWTVDTMFYGVPKSAIHAKFIYYVALQIPFGLYSTNTALPSMTQTDLQNHHFVIPPFDEQTQIADFLDKKVAQLDKVKSLLEEQIKTLEDYRQSLIYETVTKGLDKTVPLKDSGVDWIGQIPEGWGVSRLDMYVAIYGRIGFRGYTSSDIVEEGEGAISLSPSNIVEHKVVNYNNTYVSWDKYDESPEIQVQEGNILYVKTGSSYGKAGLVTSLSEKSTINPQLVIFKCRKYVEARYINYLLNCQLGKDQSELIVGGSTIPTISQEKLRKMQFPYISFDDQNQIANFLDKKTEQINQMIAIKKEQIDNINKQRQTLVYDYVTGKRRV